MTENIKFTVPPGRRILLLFLMAVAGLCITGILGALLIKIASPDRALAMMRITSVIQDILLLLIPAVATAMIVTRQPARLLALTTSPGPVYYLVAIITLLAATPFMNWVIELNASMHLPDPLDSFMREMETNAGGAIEFMLGPHTAGNLAVSILIVGILAGLCEEVFFRGALQRLMGSSMNGTAAVWITALVFSAVHLQFFGFGPRLLLGAYLGFLLLWSGSIWPSVCVHILNNSLYVILKYFTGTGDLSLGTQEHFWPYIVLSVILTSIGLYFLRRPGGGNGKNE